MKKIIPLLFTLAITATIADAQMLKKNLPNKISRSSSQKILNPQPLPPKSDDATKVQNAGNTKMLNPQPLPPKTKKRVKQVNPESTKMLNPQPLPPKADKKNKVKIPGRLRR
ncbi:MAG TPA: hypothetical protein VL053_16180 [Arachidicoccus sp.]|nr:hypothetical protein [Arachidicoccus sp.]